MSSEIVYQYINQNDIESNEYKLFVESYHGVGSFESRKQRMLWYWKLGDEGFRILTAKNGNEYIGQSCAFRVKVSINHVFYDFWWGVDSFVIKEMRGKGIGTKLQSQLHHDLQFFSSAWYSPANGAIKRKCGAEKLFNFPFAYYPVSCFFSIIIELGLKKLFSPKIIIPRIRLPWFYMRLNNFLYYGLNRFNVKEIDLHDLPKLSTFIEECLEEESFHVVRSENYLRWKYVANLRTKSRILTFIRDGKLIGVVVFSELLNQNVIHVHSRVIKVYDSIYAKNCGLNNHKILLLLCNYLRGLGEKIDGIKSLQSINWYPSFLHPKRCDLLSTFNLEKIPNGYITYMDQDMEG